MIQKASVLFVAVGLLAVGLFAAVHHLQRRQTETTSEQPDYRQGPSATNQQRQAEASHRAGVALPADAIARYAAKPFFAACLLNPEQLAGDNLFPSLPLHRIIPGSISLRKLSRMKVQQLAVFAGDAVVSGDGQLEFAFVARFPAPITPEQFAGQWQESLTDDRPVVKPKSVQIDKRHCWRVPSGTFFPAPVVHGDLRFTNEAGEPVDDGMNIGDVSSYRRYVEGDTRASAIFRFRGIEESRLFGNHLPLALRLRVFRTNRMPVEYAQVKVAMQNPRTGLRSAPLVIRPRSFLTEHLDVPSELTTPGGERIGLLTDLVSDGQLEVVIQGVPQATYIGVNVKDVAVRVPGFEYMEVHGNDVLVAQSATALQAMRASFAQPTDFARAISRSPGAASLFARFKSNVQRERLLGQLRCDGLPSPAVFQGEPIEWTATYRLDPAEFQISAQFAGTAEAAAGERLWRDQLVQLREVGEEAVTRFSENHDVRGALAQLGNGGLPLTFPAHWKSQRPKELEKRAVPPESSAQPPNQPDAEFVAFAKSHLSDALDESFECLQLQRDGKKLTARCSLSSALVQPNLLENYATAWFEEEHARHLLHFHQFDLSDAMRARVTDRLPHERQLWYRRAYELMFNQSIEFDGYARRYGWVRRGVAVMLDGIEQNEQDPDMLWITAWFIARKIGASDDRWQYRELFAEDRHLHDRLAKFVDIEQARDASGKVNCWLVCRAIHNAYMADPPKTADALPARLMFAHAAQLAAGYAQSLDETGVWEHRDQAWQEAGQEYQALATKPLPIGDGTWTLAELGSEPPSRDGGPLDDRTKHIRTAFRALQYDTWLIRCEVETRLAIKRARRAEHAGRMAAAAGRMDEARRFYETALLAIEGEFRQDPDRLTHVAIAFRPLAEGYVQACEAMSSPIYDKLKTLLPTLRNAKLPFSAPLGLVNPYEQNWAF